MLPFLTIPTIGFDLETLAYKNISLDVWDNGGVYILLMAPEAAGAAILV